MGHGGSGDDDKRSTKTVAQGAKRAASLDPRCASEGFMSAHRMDPLTGRFMIASGRPFRGCVLIDRNHTRRTSKHQGEMGSDSHFIARQLTGTAQGGARSKAVKGASLARDQQTSEKFMYSLPALLAHRKTMYTLSWLGEGTRRYIRIQAATMIGGPSLLPPNRGLDITKMSVRD